MFQRAPSAETGLEELRWEKGGAEAPCLGALGSRGSTSGPAWEPACPPLAASEGHGGALGPVLPETAKGNNPNPEGPEKDRSHKSPCPLLQEGASPFSASASPACFLP